MELRRAPTSRGVVSKAGTSRHIVERRIQKKIGGATITTIISYNNDYGGIAS